MNLQTIFVSIIILAAAIYVGVVIKCKIKSFVPKDSSCGADCGCDAKITD